MNIKKLTTLFPSLKEMKDYDSDYFAFSHGEKLYGILKSEIDPDQLTLLEAIIQPLPALTHEEQQWAKFLQQTNQSAPEKVSAYRLIMIHLQHPIEDATLFRESLQQILNKPLLFIWEHFSQVTLLEKINNHDDAVDFNEIIDVMSDDLNMNMKLFSSEVETDLASAPKLYRWMKKTAPIVWKYTNRMTKLADSMIYMLPHLFTDDDQAIFIEAILKETVDDDELLSTVKKVIECQGNVSLAAKELYMHRNSVQYRIDKFHELTGNDLKEFAHLLRVYLALLLLEK